MKIKVIFFILIILGTNSCINPKNEYPEIKYYNLSQVNTNKLDLYNINGSLLIRDIAVSSTLFGSQIMVNWDGKKIQRYFYHRWAEDFDLIAYDFFLLRISNSNLFKKGVVKNISSLLPDYLLDINILNLYVESRSNSDEINFVNAEVSVTLSKRGVTLKDNELIFTKIYNNRIVRNNNQVDNVAEFVSLTLSKITDNIIVDISNTVINQK